MFGRLVKVIRHVATDSVNWEFHQRFEKSEPGDETAESCVDKL